MEFIMEKQIEIYQANTRRIKAYQYAMWVLGWDQETETPKGAFEYRSAQIEILTNDVYEIETNSEYLSSIEVLYQNKAQLEPLLAKEINQAYRNLRIIKAVPKAEYIDFQVLLTQSPQIWNEAKQTNNFEMFAPTLEKIVKYNQNLTKYLKTNQLSGYDVLLDQYEEGFTTKIYDNFFDQLKAELVPFVISVVALRPTFSKKLSKGRFPKEKQIVFNQYLLDVFKFDRNRGLLKESAHPFSSNVSATDVRITTNYKEEALESAIFSTIHELGHGIYEQNVSPNLINTQLNHGASLGIHESQSRMYENMIGRSFAFWEVHFEKLKELFPKELKGVTILDFYMHVNVVARTLIRTEADELTYPLHIIVRYELEKQLISGQIKVKDLPKKWKKLMLEYVGVRPKTDTEGVLQDIHWAFGSIGYFPTYALGSAYAAQIYQAMNKDFNVENAISNNQIEKINDWLKNKIHQFGATKTPKELLVHATNEEFNPQYYIDYLKRKFSY